MSYMSEMNNESVSLQERILEEWNHFEYMAQHPEMVDVATVAKHFVEKMESFGFSHVQDMLFVKEEWNMRTVFEDGVFSHAMVTSSHELDMDCPF